VTGQPSVALTTLGNSGLLPTASRPAVGALHGTSLVGTPVMITPTAVVTVIAFWSTTCAACASEAGTLGELARTLPSVGARIVGVDNEDERAAALSFVHRHHLAYPNVFDPTAALQRSLAGIVPQAMPVTVVIDRHSRLAVRIVGALPSAATLVSEVRQLVAE
jgi:peroxiredoxin